MAGNLNWVGNRVADSTTPSYQANQSNNMSYHGSNQSQMQAPMQSQMHSSTQTPMQSQTHTSSQTPLQSTLPAPTTTAPGVAMPRQQVPMTAQQRNEYPVMDHAFVQGYLSENIGQNVRAEFLLGGTMYMDKSGKLLDVGVNYFILRDLVSGARIMCDLYSVKFVTTL